MNKDIEVLENIRKKDKKKLILRTIAISSFISIILFTVLSYNVYQWVRYNDCISNDGVLILYDEGRIEMLDENDSNAEHSNFKIVQSGDILVVSDTQEGYLKQYQNNILISMMVRNDMADFVSYFNPKFWFTGAREVRVYKQYIIRGIDEVIEAESQVSSNEITVEDNNVIEINGELFVN